MRIFVKSLKKKYLVNILWIIALVIPGTNQFTLISFKQWNISIIKKYVFLKKIVRLNLLLLIHSFLQPLSHQANPSPRLLICPPLDRTTSKTIPLDKSKTPYDSWQRFPNPLFYEDPPILLTPFFKFCLFPPLFVLPFSFGWMCHQATFNVLFCLIL